MSEDKEVQAALDAISAIDTLSLSDLDERQIWLSKQLLSSKESEKQLKERLALMQSDNDRLRDRVAHLEHEIHQRECSMNLERYQALIEGRGPRVDK